MTSDPRPKRVRRAAVLLLAAALLATTVATGGPPAAAAAGRVAFCDVAAGTFYADAVAWAKSTGVVNGVSATRFEPDAPTTRAQMVTFLHRYLGWRDGVSPSGPPHGFADVPHSTFYEQALRWAVAANPPVTEGLDDGTFGPDRPMSRAELAVFIHRFSGAPDWPAVSHFHDVRNGDWYTEAVAWMYHNGLTTGTGPKTYSPGRTATRAEIVTFLWRLSGEPSPASPVAAPDCQTFTAVGDSVMLGPALHGRLSPDTYPDWTGVIDATVCRQAVIDIERDEPVCGQLRIDSGLTVLRRAAATGTLGDVVIIHLGNNGPFDDDDFDAFMQATPGAGNVWFMTVQFRPISAGVPSWRDHVNDVIRRGVARWHGQRGVGILDWYALTVADPGLVSGNDLTHLTAAGERAYADLVGRALAAS